MSTTVTIGNKRRATREESVAAVKRSRRAYLAKRRRYSVNTKFHNFVRSVSFRAPSAQLGYDQRTGFTWNGVALNTHNLQFNFTLGGVNIFAGGTAIGTGVLPMPNVTELTTLYDQYRIDWIECDFFFSNNMSNVTSPTTVLPICYMCKDYDDSADAGVTDIQQYTTQMVWQWGQQQGRNGKYTVRIKPNVDTVVFQSALLSGYGRGKPQFIDTSSGQVPHYGIKLAVDPIFIPPAATPIGYLTCNFKYHLTMGHTK